MATIRRHGLQGTQVYPARYLEDAVLEVTAAQFMGVKLLDTGLQLPDSGEPVEAGIGRYGPYIRYQGRYVNIPADEDVLTIGLNRAVTLLAEAPKKGGATPLKVLGEHPEGGEVSLNSGRYGPYVKHGKVYATLPKTVDKDSLTLEQALELIAQKAAKGKSPAKKRKKA